MRGIGAAVKLVDFYLCRWGLVSSKCCSFFIVSLSKSLSLYFMCSDQHAKYWMPHGFCLTNSLLLNYNTFILNLLSTGEYIMAAMSILIASVYIVDADLLLS